MMLWDRLQREQPLMTPDGGRREKPGLRMRTRMQRNKAAYCYVDPDYLATFGPPPPQVQAAFEDVFGRDRIFEGNTSAIFGEERRGDFDKAERLKVRLHPHMKRWCLYERTFEPEHGTNLWKVISIFMEEPRDGYLPPDFDGDPYLAHFRGMIGDFRLPTKEDFEVIERTDRKKYGADGVEEFLHQPEVAAKAEAERVLDDRAQDIADYSFWAEWQAANQRAGSGQKPWSTASVELRSDPRKYRRVQKNGYTLIEKINDEGRSHDDQRTEDRLAALSAFEQKMREERGLVRGTRRTEEERRLALEDAPPPAPAKTPEAERVQERIPLREGE